MIVRFRYWNPYFFNLNSNPHHHSTENSATTEPIETYFVENATIKNSPIPLNPIIGLIAMTAPTPVATALPPLNPM